VARLTGLLGATAAGLRSRKRGDVPELVSDRGSVDPPERAAEQHRQGRAVAQSLVVLASGVFSSVCACFTVSQLPKRTPLEATRFTRVIPLARTGASRPLSAGLDRQFAHRRDPHVD